MKQKLHLASCALLLLLLGAGACFGVTVTGHDGTRLSLSQIGDIVRHVTGQTFGELKFEKDSLYIFGASFPRGCYMDVHSFNLDGSNNHLASIENNYLYDDFDFAGAIATPLDYQSIFTFLTSAPEGDDNKVLLNLFLEQYSEQRHDSLVEQKNEYRDYSLWSLAAYMSGKPENGKLNMQEDYFSEVGDDHDFGDDPLVDVKGGMSVKNYDGEVTAYLFRASNTIHLYLGNVRRESDPVSICAVKADSGEWSASVADADLPKMLDGTPYFPASMAVGDFDHDGYKNEIVVVYSDRSAVHYSVLQIAQLTTIQ